MKGRWLLPAWTGPDSPQTPIRVEDQCGAETKPRGFPHHGTCICRARPHQDTQHRCAVCGHLWPVTAGPS